MGAGFIYLRAGFYLLFRTMEVHFSRDDCIGEFSPTMRSWGDFSPAVGRARRHFVTTFASNINKISKTNNMSKLNKMNK